MRKNFFIGGTAYNKYCGLLTPYSFDELQKNVKDIEASDFTTIKAYDWGGGCDLDVCIRLTGVKFTGREIVLANPIVFEGKDLDHGHEYKWTCTVERILECEVVE